MLMKILIWGLVLLAVLAVALALAGQLGLLKGTPPNNLGVRDGRMKAPSGGPNSVSSQAALYPDHPQRQASEIAPIALRGDGPATLARIKTIAQGMPGAKIVKGDGDYLYAQFTTPLMKFVDDTEFWYDPAAQLIQVRSASRVGKRDFAVNRKRIEAVRAALMALP